MISALNWRCRNIGTREIGLVIEPLRVGDPSLGQTADAPEPPSSIAAMCDRYVTPAQAEIERFWHLCRHNNNSLGPRYNVSPNVLVPMLRRSDIGGLDLLMARWGPIAL